MKIVRQRKINKQKFRNHSTLVRSWRISWCRVKVWETISDPPDDTQSCICKFTCCSCFSSRSIPDSRSFSCESPFVETLVETNLRYEFICSSNWASSFLAYNNSETKLVITRIKICCQKQLLEPTVNHFRINSIFLGKEKVLNAKKRLSQWHNPDSLKNLKF